MTVMITTTEEVNEALEEAYTRGVENASDVIRRCLMEDKSVDEVLDPHRKSDTVQTLLDRLAA